MRANITIEDDDGRVIFAATCVDPLNFHHEWPVEESDNAGFKFEWIERKPPPILETSPSTVEWYIGDTIYLRSYFAASMTPPPGQGNWLRLYDKPDAWMRIIYVDGQVFEYEPQQLLGPPPSLHEPFLATDVEYDL